MRSALSRLAGTAALALPASLAAQATATPAAPAQAAAPAAPAAFDLSVRNIMRGPELYGREPQQVRWTPDGQWIYFQWLAPGARFDAPMETWRVRPSAGARPERVTPAHLDTAGPLVAAGPLSGDRRLRAVAWQGDVWVVDQRTARARRVTDTPAAERSPRFDATAARVFYVRENNLFAVDLATGLTRQLTDVRVGPAPDSTPATPQRKSLEQQQRALLESVREKLARDSLQKAEKERLEARRPKPLHLQKEERVDELVPSPRGDVALLVTVTPGKNAKEAQVPDFVSTSGYTEPIETRTKVGDAQSVSRVGVLTLATGAVKWIDALPGAKGVAPGDLAVLGWNERGDAALFYAVSADYTTRALQAVDGAGATTALEVLRDSAWVGGPCSECAGWYDGGRRAWYVSEADGFAHLYTVAADGTQRRQLTSGKWEVLDVALTPDERRFLLHTSEPSPFERHAYLMDVGGGTRTRLTADTGGHTVVMSRDGRRLADVFSQSNRPPELYVQDARAGARAAQLTTSPTPEFLAHRWLRPDIVMVPASDGAQVPGRVYRPQDVGATPNGAAVIFVHGAGYLHNVHRWWSTYAREYMFHHLLASRGYVVLDLDYRASAGYGRDWRTAIYRHMGGRDLQDQVDGSRWLQRTYGIPAERVGIYGGSYGGFITLMALFTEAKSFGAGAALRSVTDWAHYNHPYTARILNEPQADTLAFRRSSPIYFADGLEDPLLIAHGMVDTNVHFQDVVRLSERLIELGKTNWEMAVYPVEDHAFTRPASWADEYRRILELFDRTLPESVPLRSTVTEGGRR